MLRLGHLFGLKNEAKDNIHYIDENEVIYPVGHTIVCFNLEKKTQKILSLDSSAGSQISALAVHTGRQKLLAVAERGEKAQITVFDLSTGKKKGKSPLTGEVQAEGFVCVSFSPDGKQLLALSGAPDFTLVNFLWEKNKVLQTAQVSNGQGAAMNQCSFCPTDPSTVCVSGNGVLRFLRLEQTEFKSIQFTMGKREPQNYVCHTWVDDRILVGTEAGDILVFENAEFRGILESSPANGKSIDSIAAFSKGFVCGCEEGILYIFERDEKEIYKESKSFQIDGNYTHINHLSISPSESSVACTLQNGQIFMLSLANTEILQAEEMNFEHLVCPFHQSAVLCVDGCLRKPIIASCGEDNSVRVWNYADQTAEIVRFYEEMPIKLSLHPSGFHALIAFTDCVRLANLLIDEIRDFKELQIKRCAAVAFSEGGQFFALDNSNLLQIYTSYTCELLMSLRGHKGRIQCLQWSNQDSNIISAGIDGQILEWELKSGSKLMEWKNESGSPIRAISLVEKTLFALDEDSALYQIEKGATVNTIELKVKVTSLAATPTVICLVCGLESGSIRIYRLPFTGHFSQLDVHCSSVSVLKFSIDRSFIFSASTDGSLAILEISDDDEAKSRLQLLPWAEELLINRGDLEEKLRALSELKGKVEELQHNSQAQLKQREIDYQEKLRQVTEKFQLELSSEKDKFESLEETKEQMETRFHNVINDLETKQTKKLSELEQHHKEKIGAETERLKQLEGKFVRMKQEWELEVHALENRYNEEIQTLESEFERSLSESIQLRRKLQQTKEEVIEDFEETKLLMEEDTDKEIDELKAQFDQKLTVERLNTLRLKDENAILKRKFAALRDEIKEQKEAIAKKEDRQRLLYDEIRALEKDVEAHIKEIQERESTIGDKVKRIMQLKKKNQELEKFKFVLEYKIKELTRQILPRQNEIKQMDAQLAQMSTELSQYQSQSAHLQLTVHEFQLKLNGMENEIEKQEVEQQQLSSQMRRIRSDLSSLCANVNDNKKLKDGLQYIFHKHVSKDLSLNTQLVLDDNSSFQKQRYYLERNVESLQKKIKKDVTVFAQDHSRIVAENIALVREINELRRETQLIQMGQQLKEQQQQAKIEAQSVKMKPRIGSSGAVSELQLQLEREIEIQKMQIKALQAEIDALDD